MWKDTEAAIAHVDQAFANADALESKLPPDVLAMRGMSGTKTRHLYNNLCAARGVRYLEIGCWAGSSFVSAMYGNHDVHGVAIDNWSEFGGPRNEFVANVNRFLDGQQITLIEADCFVAATGLPDGHFDVYMFDGAHSEDDHRRAMTELYPKLRLPAVVVVDDWRLPEVQRGTMAGLEEVGARVAHKVEKLTTHEEPTGYWNGTVAFVLAP